MDGVKVVVHPLQVVLPLLDGLLHLPLASSEGLLVLITELDQLKLQKKDPSDFLLTLFLIMSLDFHLVDVKPGVSVGQHIFH